MNVTPATYILSRRDFKSVRNPTRRVLFFRRPQLFRHSVAKRPNVLFVKDDNIGT